MPTASTDSIPRPTSVSGSQRGPSVGKRLYDSRWLYLFLLPAVTVVILLSYWPMYGIQLAFKDYVTSKGFWGSPWVGFEHFSRFFRSSMSMKSIIMMPPRFLSRSCLAIATAASRLVR